MTVEIETYPGNAYFTGIPECQKMECNTFDTLHFSPSKGAKQGAEWGPIMTTDGKHLVERFWWNRPPEPGPSNVIFQEQKSLGRFLCLQLNVTLLLTACPK